jgi:glycosyltransferase involved in cell wall biosynthesis
LQSTDGTQSPVCPLRIGVVADDLYPGFGGQAAATEGHVEALVDLGHEVRVLAGASRDPGKAAESRFVPPGVRVERVPAWRPTGKQMHFAPPIFGRRARAMLRWADVVQVNTMTPLGCQALWLARRLRVPSVLGFHHQEENVTLHLDRTRPLVVPGLRAWFRLVGRLPDAVVAPTPFAARYAARYTRAPIHVVSNGIRLPETGAAERYRAQDEEVRDRLLSGGGRFLLCSVGRLDPEKRPKDLLDVMAALSSRGWGEVRLAVAGSGPMRDALEAEAAGRGLDGTVRFLGYVSEIEKDALLRGSDLFLVPSPTELQNVAMLEAISRGCAVVAADAPTSAVPELVRGADCGLLYDPDYPEDAALAILRLLEDGGELRRLQKNALLAASEHDVRESGRRLVALYRDVIRWRGLSADGGSGFLPTGRGGR